MSITTSGGLTVKELWSVAGFATCIHISGEKLSENILFDCGICNRSTVPAKHIFITHGHVDHIGAIVNHARARALSYSPANYYVPGNCVESINSIKEAYQALDEHEIKMNIIPFQIGESVKLNNFYEVFSFPTVHRVRSQGYGIKYARKVMRREFQNLDKRQINKLREEGVNMFDVQETVDIVYSGDTEISGLLSPGNEFVFTAEILLIEVTYLDGDISKAHQYGHIHLQELVSIYERFRNRQIIFVHLSARYGPHSRALTVLHQHLPEAMRSYCSVALFSLGSDEHVTSLERLAESIQTSRVGWGWGRGGRGRRPYKRAYPG